MQNRVKFIFKNLIGLIYITAIFYFSLRQSNSGPIPFQHFDKIIHFFAYATLGLYYQSIIKNNFITIIIFIVMGISIEILQFFSGYRYFEILDIMANSLGVITGTFIYSKKLSIH